MNKPKRIFFDVGYTLINEEDVWNERCAEQAMTREAKVLGLSSDDIYRSIVAASLAYRPQYRTVVKKYGFTEVAPYRDELEKPYPEALPV